MIGGIGRVFITLGVIILLFVAYQLWGTGIAEARSQGDLRDEFSKLQQTTPTTVADDPTVGSGSGNFEEDGPPPPPQGSAVGIIKIPKLGLEKAIVEGAGVEDLQKGPGHYPGTPLPGQEGNAAIAGHRTTYGAPFNRLDELRPGDVIYVTTLQGEFEYHVSDTRIVGPDEVSVLDPTPDSRLTLTTCHPKFSAAQRLIVIATLQGEAAPASKGVAAGPGDFDTDSPLINPGDGSLAGEELDPGLSGDPTARTPSILWALACAAVWLATWLFARRWRKWPAYAIGTPIFLLALFVCFENVSRMIPADF